MDSLCDVGQAPLVVAMSLKSHQKAINKTLSRERMFSLYFQQAMVKDCAICVHAYQTNSLIYIGDTTYIHL